MKKLFLIAVLSLFTAFNLLAADYKVLETTGTVTYQKEPGSWSNVTKGQVLTAETVINIGLNSTAKIAYGRFVINLKPMRKGTVEQLTADVFAKHKITKSNVAPASMKSTKAVITAASRASEARDDLVWDEDDDSFYEID